MGKHAGRITALGFTVAASAALALPGSAAAAPSPTINGDCSATLQNGKTGEGLALDAGAPINAPNRLTVGLDSSAKTSDGRSPLLTLPVGDVVKSLGVGEVPVVGDAASKAVCPVAQNLVNTVGNTTQGVAGDLPPVPLPPNPNPPQPPGPPAPPQPQPPAPGPNPPGNVLAPVLSGDGLPGDEIGTIISNAALLPGASIQPPVVVTVIPGQGTKVPTVDAQKSGSAQALPAVNPPAKLPMLLAVLALAVVAAALVRAFLRRRPA